jgi:hypothetical protein
VTGASKDESEIDFAFVKEQKEKQGYDEKKETKL